MEKKNRIEITYVEKTLAPLFHRYPRQDAEQAAFIELDLRNETLCGNWNAEIGNAVPFSVYHGHERNYSIPATANGEAINELLDTLLPLAEKLLDTYESAWDGNNHVAHFQGSAPEIEQEIESTISDWARDLPEVTVIYDWDEWFENETSWYAAARSVASLEEFRNSVEGDLANDGVIDATPDFADEWLLKLISRRCYELSKSDPFDSFPAWVQNEIMYHLEKDDE